VKLIWAQEFPSRYEALSFERQIKGWSHKKKQALIEDDIMKIHQIVKQERQRKENK